MPSRPVRSSLAAALGLALALGGATTAGAVHRQTVGASYGPVSSVGSTARGHHGHGHDRGTGAGAHDGDVSRVYPAHLPALATIGGVDVVGSGYGSSLAARPGSTDVVYGLTDRGPNVDGPEDTKIEPLPDFTPSIGEFRLGADGRAHLLRAIPLRDKDGTPMNGRVSTIASTGETITDLAGHPLAASPHGIDSEGLAAMRDGSFWVSDEYGPFIAHFDACGRMIERLSPQEGTLPGELAEREVNKGMEGLTVTPDGRTLVGIMQAALNAPDNTGTKSKKISALRIVTVDLRTRATKEYVYVLHNKDGADTVVSEISALDDHTLLVDERDSDMEPGANKKLWKIDLTGATDVGPRSTVKGATYDAAKGGLLVGGRSIERLAGKGDSDDTTKALKAAGITPVRSGLFLDVAGYVTHVDPKGGYFGHDKVEGVAVLDGGRRVILSDDSDFGIDAATGDKPPYGLHVKTLPDGSQDDGEMLSIDVRRVPAAYRG